MTFFVYQNWTIKRGRAHFADCSYCNAGKGIHAVDSGKNGKWHEAATADDADKLLIGLSTDGYDMAWCAACQKRRAKC
jgi:hypothetical protein